MNCWEELLKDNVFDGARQVISQLRNSGVRQVLLSGTLTPLARPLMAYLEINEIIAAGGEIVNGRYSGRLTKPHPHGKHKTLYVGRWLAENSMT